MHSTDAEHFCLPISSRVPSSSSLTCTSGLQLAHHGLLPGNQAQNRTWSCSASSLRRPGVQQGAGWGLEELFLLSQQSRGPSKAGRPLAKTHALQHVRQTWLCSMPRASKEGTQVLRRGSGLPWHVASSIARASFIPGTVSLIQMLSFSS